MNGHKNKWNENSLHKSLTRVDEELADMRVSMSWLKNELYDLKDMKRDTSASQSIDVLNPTPAESSAMAVKRGNRNPASDVSIEIHRAIVDLTRQNRNVIITGLPQTTYGDDSVSSDKDAFIKLCEN